MYRKILVPFDRSEAARHALRDAIELATCLPDAKVTVVTIIDRTDYNTETFKIAARFAGVSENAIDPSMLAADDVEDSTEVKALREDVAPTVEGHEDIVSYDVVMGNPHDAITAFATRGGYDCIVMGHRGMGAVRGMLGSVCYSVLHKTSIPVLIVK